MYGASHLKWKSLGDEDMEEEEDEHVSTAGRSLKLSAPKVGNFSGDPAHWPKWKASTIVTFVATGYEKVLTSRKYALKNKSKNKIVYAILSNATIDGHSHHRIKNHEGYLGTSLKRIEDGRIQMNSEDYIKEAIRKYEAKFDICLKKENIPMAKDAHPELDDSDFLNTEAHKQFQHIIGLGQWIVLTGRIDITYAVSSLARFASSPREQHIIMARRILGYLKKFSKKGIVIDPRPPTISEDEDDKKRYEDFGHQYRYFKEPIDPEFPDAMIEELLSSIFVDADHAHDVVTGRSITGLRAFIGSTPIYSKSKRQSCVNTSTYGAELTVLKAAVELAITLRYHLRSIGIKITKPTKIFVDNKSVVVNAVNPACSLNKKAIALSYHFVRQHQAAEVINIFHITRSENN